MEIASPLPIIGIVIAGLTSLATAIWGKEEKNRRLFGTVGSILTFLFVASMIPGTLNGKIYTTTIVNFFSGAKIGSITLQGISFKFRVDALALLFAVVSSSMWVLVNFYTIGYMDHEEHKHRFFTFFSLAVCSALGIALSENLINFFLFYEILTLSTYPLVMHSGTKEAFKAGTKYLIYTLTGGGFLLAAIIVTYIISGTISLSQPGILSNTGVSPFFLRIIFFGFLIGFGVKAGIMPMHHWLPGAMVAPTPVSTLLHAVAVVKAGVFGILRLCYSIFGPELMNKLSLDLTLAWIASFTIITASIIAIRQDNLKRRLAYSTISQLSFIVLGAALVSKASLVGAMIHIANHAFTKGTLFMCAGIIMHETGFTNISQMKGVAKRLPITMIAFSIAALGMMGAPPVAGFVSEWIIGTGAIEGGKPIFLYIIILNALLDAIYFMPIIYNAYFGKPDKEFEIKEKETTPFMLRPIMGTAAMTFVLGIFAGVQGLPMSIANIAKDFFF